MLFAVFPICKQTARRYTQTKDGCCCLFVRRVLDRRGLTDYNPGTEAGRTQNGKLITCDRFVVEGAAVLIMKHFEDFSQLK